MKKVNFRKSNLINIGNPPTNSVSVWLDTNSVFNSLDENGNSISIGSLINKNTQTGTTYSLLSTDGGKIIEMNNSSTNSVTIPTNAAVPFQIGTQILVSQYGAGQTGFTWSSGTVTVRSVGNKTKLNGQYSAATLLKRDTNEWYLFGDITS